MRIIGGKLRGLQLKAPDNLPVRPTTDMAKEALFNILHNRFDLESCTILDLFTGTGNVSIEFLSRNSAHVTAIDRHPGCIKWMELVKARYNLDALETRKADVFKFLELPGAQFDIIFADPPYDLPGIPKIPQLVMNNSFLKEGGILIVEHPRMLKLDNQPGYTTTRSYGNSSFSFFELS